MFYVSRDGVSPAEGEPVGRGRLVEMLRSGELGSAALVMAPGADEWFPARLLLEEAERARAEEVSAGLRARAAQERRTKPKRNPSSLALRTLALLVGCAGLALGLGGCGMWATTSVAADEAARDGMDDLGILMGYMDLPPENVLELMRKAEAEDRIGLLGMERMLKRLTELEEAGTLELSGHRAMRETVAREQRALLARVKAMREDEARKAGVGILGGLLLVLSMLMTWSARKMARG